MNRHLRSMLCSVVMALGVVVAPSVGRAFHAASTFADAPGAGGGGGLYYVGSPRERGWTCAACHTKAPGNLRVRFSSDLFRSFTYTPGATSDLMIRIENEALGLSAGLSNFNGMVLSVLDQEGRAAGTFTNATPDQYEIRSTSRGDLAIASAGRDTGVTEWSFQWVAPPAATGTVTLYLAVVDGNGADSPPTLTLTDPWGDDLYLAEVVLDEEGTTASILRLSPREPPAWRTLSGALLATVERRRRGILTG